MKGSGQSVKQLITVKSKLFLKAFRRGEWRSISKLETKNYFFAFP